MKKPVLALLLVGALTSVCTISVAAAENNQDVVKDIDSGGTFVNRATGDISQRNMIVDGNYNVYMDKGWVFNSRGVGVGAWGTSKVVDKNNGDSSKWHYTNVVVYTNSDETNSSSSGRTWGSETVRASTGDAGIGTIHHYYVYYGW